MLKSVTLQNFKSYTSLTKLTFPHQFTAIIGPNGSGKSNAISAISAIFSQEDQDSTIELEFEESVYKKHKTLYYINDQEIQFDLFIQQIPLIILPNTDLFIMDNLGNSDAESVTEESIINSKVQLKELTEQLLSKRKLYHRVKDQVEKIKTFQSNQKLLLTSQQEQFLLEIDQLFLQIEQSNELIQNISNNLKSYPEHNELQSLLAQSQDIDTQILKQQFQLEQIKAKQSEVQPLAKKFKLNEETLLRKQSIIQESMQRFRHQIQENEQTKVNSISELKNLQNVQEQQKIIKISLPPLYFELLASFNQQFDADLSKKYQIKHQLIEYRNQIDVQQKQLSKRQESLSQEKLKYSQKSSEIVELDQQYIQIKQKYSESQNLLKDALDQKQKSNKRQQNLSQQIIQISQKLESVARNNTAQKQQAIQRKISQIFQDKFTGFKGIVKDLLKASNSKHQKALNFSCGGLLNAYVVEDFETASQAVIELKLRKLPVCTFIPLQSLKQYQNTRQDMLVNFVQKKSGLENLFGFICRNTILNDENPRQLATQTGMRVVTTDCKIFSPSGALSAEIGNGVDNQQDAIDFQKLDNERDNLQQLLLKEEQNITQKQLIIDQLQNQILPDFEFQLNSEQQKLQSGQVLKIKFQNQVDEHTNIIQDIKDKLFKLKRDEEVQVQLLQNQIDLIDKMKLEFFAILYTDNLKISGKEFLELEKNTQLDDQLDLQKQIIVLQQKIEIIDGQDYFNDIGRLNIQINKINDQIKENKSNNGINQALIIENAAKIDQLTNQLQLLQDNQNQLKLQISGKQSQFQQNSQEQESLVNQLHEEKSNIKHYNLSLVKIIERVFTDQIILPSNSEHPELLLEAFITQQSDPVQFLKNTYQIDLDFKKKLKISPTQRIQELKANIITIKQSLQQDIDFEAQEQLPMITEELNALQTQHQQLKQYFMKISKSSSLKQTSQLDSYSTFINQLETAADSFYKLFTHDQGTISLTPKQFNEVQIMAVPPGDGVRNFSDLSGGEQALITLCCTLARCEVLGGKVVFFDEIDANIDDEKAKEISSKMSQLKIQVICVSHKIEFCEGAGGLCGVAKREGEGSQSWWVWK